MPAIADWLAIGRTRLTTPSLPLQVFDLLRSFRFGPSFIEFFPSFAAQRLEIGALRASHRLIFCYPLVGIFLRIECRGRHIWRNIVGFSHKQSSSLSHRWT